MLINQEHAGNRGVTTGGVPVVSAVQIASLARTVVPEADKATSSTGHKRSGSGVQRQTKHSVFNYEPLTAEQQDDNNDDDIQPAASNNNIRTDARGDRASTASAAGALKPFFRQSGPPTKGFTTALRRSLSPSSRLHSLDHQHGLPVSPNADEGLTSSSQHTTTAVAEVSFCSPGTPTSRAVNKKSSVLVSASGGGGFIQKAKSALTKRSVLSRPRAESILPIRDVDMANRISSSASNMPTPSSSSPFTGPVVNEASAVAQQGRTPATVDDIKPLQSRGEQRRSLTHAFPRGLSFPRGATDRVVDDIADEFEDDDISSPYNADDIETHVMPHGPAPDRDLQYLFNAPLQHRVPVDESEARKLERDLKALMAAFDNGHGDPFGLENDSIVQTMHELREKQEYITAQMFALDHTEYWNAENRFGMHKMKDRLDGMITAVDDLCQTLRQLPSHDELGTHFPSKSASRRRRRRSQRTEREQRGDCYDEKNKDAGELSVSISDAGEDDFPAAAAAADDDDEEEAAAGGITIDIPPPMSSRSVVPPYRNRSDINSASEQQAAHKRSASHPKQPLEMTGGMGAAVSMPPLPESTKSVRARLASRGGGGGDQPPVSVPQAPPRATRRTKAAGVASGDDSAVFGSAHKAADSGDRKNFSALPATLVSSTPITPNDISVATYYSDNDESSSDVTLNHRRSVKDGGKVTPTTVKVAADNVQYKVPLAPPPLPSSLRTNTNRKPAAVLELAERSPTTPLHSPSTESFQSAMSPYLSS